MYTTEQSKMWKEIFEQPSAIRNSLQINVPLIKEIAREVETRNIKTVVLVGRGSSDHANMVARYLFETYCGMIVSISAPAVVTAYHGNVDYSNVLMIAVSQSGAARDIFEVMKECDRQGGLCVSITNNRGSLMTTAGKYALNNECGPETSITAAKSYLTQVTLLTAFAAQISGNTELLDALNDISEVTERALLLENQVRSAIPLFRNSEHMMIFGRGLLYALGMETELKVQETSYFDARCYASSDYRHGPIATAQRFVPTMFFIADKATDYCPIDLHNRLKRETAIFSLIVTNKPEIAKLGDISILLPEDMDGIRAVYAGAVVSQMFACLLSISRGYNPDEPVGVTKTTVTL